MRVFTAMNFLRVLLAIALCAVSVLADTEYYDILKVSPSASESEIKKAYRKLAKEYHPDKNKDDQNANEMFQKVAEAYEILSDPDKRAMYDEHGKEGLQQTPGNDPFGFESFFGGMNRGRRQQPKGSDLRVKLDVTLEDLYMGRTIELEVSNQQLCPHCRGSGADSKDDVKTCTVCHGTGVQIVRHQVAPGFIQQMQHPCPSCKGQGKTIKKKCHVCGGTKVVRGTNVLTLEVERGMDSGETIIFSRMADQLPGHIAGDLVYVLEAAPHAVYRRLESHLYTTITVSLAEALLGFSRTIEHLDGRAVVVERTTVTQPGQVITLEGEGMPKHHFPSEFGNLYVEVTVVLPASLTPDQAKALKESLP